MCGDVTFVLRQHGFQRNMNAVLPDLVETHPSQGGCQELKLSIPAAFIS